MAFFVKKSTENLHMCIFCCIFAAETVFGYRFWVLGSGFWVIGYRATNDKQYDTQKCFCLCNRLALCSHHDHLYGMFQESEPTPTPQVEETLKGNISRPTTWTVSDAYDYTSSMTSIVKVDLLKQYPELAKDFRLTNDDLLGAFTENGDCIGVVSPEDDGLFFLFINGVEGNVTLRYWSGYYTNIFNGESFPFVNDGRQGTYAEPYVPLFTVAK